MIVLADRSGAGEWNGDEGGAAAQATVDNGAACGDVVRRRVSARDDRSRRSRAACGSNARVRIGARSAGVGRARACARSPPTDRRAMSRCRWSATRPARRSCCWEHATVGGIALTSLLAEPERQRAQLDGLRPRGRQAPTRSRPRRSPRSTRCRVERDARSPVSSVPTSAWASGRERVALPVRLGAAGIERVMLPELSAGERVALGARAGTVARVWRVGQVSRRIGENRN